VELLKPVRCRWLARAALGVAAMSAACSYPDEPAPVPSAHRAVFSVIEVGSPVARLIGRDVAADAGLKPLANAAVTISGAGSVATLASTEAAAPDCFAAPDVDLPAWGIEGCYAGRLTRSVEPSTAYALSVVLPDGSRVSGSLTTPAVPSASIPADSQRVSVLTYSSPDGLPIAIVPIELAAAPGSGRVDAFTTVRRGWTVQQGKPTTFDVSRCTSTSQMLPFRLARFPDSKDLWIYSASCGVSWDSVDVDVHVVGADPNYAGYANSVLSGLATPAAASGFGLSGAVGVFGALAERVLSLRLRYCGPRAGVVLCPEMK
jgi:hypothetical protein